MPDLTFSELRFLNTSKAQLETGPMPEKKKSKKKDVDHNEKLSRFFASTGAPPERKAPNKAKKEMNIRLDHVSSKEYKAHEIQSSTRTSPATPVDLPNRPFLGFGEPGPRPSSLLDPNEIHTIAVPSAQISMNASTARSTSYFTWSQSPVIEREFINRIPPHSETRSLSQTKRCSLSKIEKAGVKSDHFAQQTRGSISITKNRQHHQIKTHKSEYLMYGALQGKSGESILESLSPRTIPRSEDGRRDLENFLMKRVEEFDRRGLNKGNSAKKSPRDTSIQVRKSRGPPVIMEGTEALTAVLDNWFEKHERRFARLATARTDSPDQNHKEVQELLVNEQESQTALLLNERIVGNAQSQERLGNTTNALRGLPSSHKAESPKEQQETNHLKPSELPHQMSPRSRVEKSPDARQEAPNPQNMQEPASMIETSDSAVPPGWNRVSGTTSTNPQTSHNQTTAIMFQWQPQGPALSITEHWREPGTVYGQHLEEVYHRLPYQDIENDSRSHATSPDLQCAYSPIEPSADEFQSERIGYSAHSDYLLCEYPNDNATSGDPGMSSMSAITHDHARRYREEDVYQMNELYGDQELYPEFEQGYVNHQNDHPTPTYIPRSQRTSPDYRSETVALGGYDECKDSLSVLHDAPHLATLLRTRRRVSRSIGRLSRDHEALSSPVNEMEIKIPPGFWRPALGY